MICGFPMFESAVVVPDAAKRRSGIHFGALPEKVQAWVSGLPAVAQDDAAFEHVPQRRQRGKMA